MAMATKVVGLQASTRALTSTVISKEDQASLATSRAISTIKVVLQVALGTRKRARFNLCSLRTEGPRKGQQVSVSHMCPQPTSSMVNKINQATRSKASTPG
jgi:hypothetical protein